MPNQNLAASVIVSTPLLYQEGALAEQDRPAHVRSASGIARAGGWFVIVQDDANFIALADLTGKNVRAVNLPAGEGGKRLFDDERGNKKFKMDLESCVLIAHQGQELLITFGSGSTRYRENVVILRDPGGAPRPEVRPAPELYAALRSAENFAGSELNIEGALFLDGKIKLFNRGNGSRSEENLPVNASCDLDWRSLYDYLTTSGKKPPVLENVVRYDLGMLEDTPLGFTDATSFGGKIFFSAAAEASPDAVTDGEVSGSVLGILEEGNNVRWTEITGADGKRFRGKVEGITLLNGGPDRLLAVIDQDSPHKPSELCEIRLDGAWL